MIEKIEQLMQEISALQAKNAQEAEVLRIKYLSKKGEISQLMNDFRSVPAEMKKEVGMKINELKNFAQEKINALKEGAGEASASGSAAIDLTRTPIPLLLAHAIRSRLSRMKSSISSAVLASRLQKVLRLKTIGTFIAV